MSPPGVAVRGLDVRTYRVPTPGPEADGTASWSATEVLVVRVVAEDVTGLGWSYCAAPAAARLVEEVLRQHVVGADALDVAAVWTRMVAAVRNAGRPGVASMAVAAVDLALWDLKARLLELPLDRLLGRARDAVPVYGSGGFVSMSDEALAAQLRRWTADLGIPRVKIKVGERSGAAESRDLARTRVARQAVGPDVELFVDANGGYSPGQARRLGRAYEDLGVTWFEEPVPSDDVSALALLRETLALDVAAGEYGDGVRYATRLCVAGAVDCLQVDVTRCAGISEWLRCAAVAAGHGLQVSAHCAPALHTAVALHVPNLRHVELFADHERLEPMLFDGVPTIVSGHLVPQDAPGHGMTLAARAEDLRA